MSKAIIIKEEISQLLGEAYVGPSGDYKYLWSEIAELVQELQHSNIGGLARVMKKCDVKLKPSDDPYKITDQLTACPYNEWKRIYSDLEDEIK